MTTIDHTIGYVIPALPKVLSQLPKSCMGLCIVTSRDCTVPCHPTNTQQVVIPLQANHLLETAGMLHYEWCRYWKIKYERTNQVLHPAFELVMVNLSLASQMMYAINLVITIIITRYL